MALAYFVAELWHGASRRTWLLARVAAAVALMGPVILWLLRQPLVPLANVEAVNPGSQACSGQPGQPRGDPVRRAVVVVAVVDDGRAVSAARRPGAAARRRTAAQPARHSAAGGDGESVAGRCSRDAALPGDRSADRASRRSCPRSSPCCSPSRCWLVAIQVVARPRRPAVRRPALVAAAGGLVRDPLPEHLGAAAAVAARERVPGAAADVPVPVPVLGQHRRSDRGDLVLRPAVRILSRSWCGLRRRRLLRLGVAARRSRGRAAG